MENVEVLQKVTQALAVTWLTDVVEAVGLSGFGAQIGDAGPVSVAVRVALDQIIRRLTAHDPVA